AVAAVAAVVVVAAVVAEEGGVAAGTATAIASSIAATNTDPSLTFGLPAAQAPGAFAFARCQRLT
ncbi:MAG: hypothetical protein ACREOK_08515, partial [Gemmatimonadaceae bacterium]